MHFVCTQLGLPLSSVKLLKLPEPGEDGKAPSANEVGFDYIILIMNCDVLTSLVRSRPRWRGPSRRTRRPAAPPSSASPTCTPHSFRYNEIPSLKEINDIIFLLLFRAPM